MPALPAAPRIPYDRPELGATVVAYDSSGGNIVEASAADVEILVGEDDTYFRPSSDVMPGWLAVVLPPFDLAGFIGIRSSSLSDRTAQYSTDTTNGFDGTWTDIPNYVTPGSSAKPTYRDDLTIPASVVENVVAVRFGTTSSALVRNQYRLLHVYGYLRGDDRLELWHPTLDQRLPGDHFDLGNYARGGSAVDVDFRVKNLSGTKQANNVSLERYVNTDTGEAPTVESWHELAYDGGAFSAGPLSLGNLAPGAISAVCTLRRQPPSDAVLGFWTGHLFAAAETWS